MDLGPLALTRSYDQRYQITGIQAGTVLNYGYTHDGAGNVETISGLPKPDFFPRLADLTYNANRMATQNTDWIGAGVVLPSPAAVYSHDAAGNIVSDGLHTDYSYNQNNRLIRVEIDGFTVAEYAYDAFERRVKKVVNGVTTHFHYDLNGLLISETDGNGNPRKDYVYLNGEPVAMKVYGGLAGWYWFINDHLGTPQKMVDESGSVVWAAAYAPFGEARVYQDEVVNNLRFPGQYYDVETGLHYNWHRYYDPRTGRYLRADPIGLAGGMNVYVYAQNNPANLIDPHGLMDWKLMASSSLGIVGNGLGVFVGSALISAPEPTMATKIVGGVVLGKSVAGWGLNWYNFTQSFRKDCSNYEAPSSAARAIASLTSPGNMDAQRAADILDLSIDLLSGRGAIKAYGKPSFPGIGKSVTKGYDPASKIFKNPKIVPLFLGTQVVSTGVDNIAR
jgi:RHS repeat-associated protein